MEPSRFAVVLVAAVLAISVAYAAAQIGSGPGIGPATAPAAGIVRTGTDAPEVRLGGRGRSDGSWRSIRGADSDGSTLPPLLAEPRSSAQ